MLFTVMSVALRLMSVLTLLDGVSRNTCKCISTVARIIFKENSSFNKRDSLKSQCKLYIFFIRFGEFSCCVQMLKAFADMIFYYDGCHLWSRILYPSEFTTRFFVGWVRVARLLVFCVVFCRSLFVLLSLFFRPFHCLIFYLRSIICKTLYRKLNIEQHELHKKLVHIITGIYL
jgi:hypothetical protein